MTIFYLKHAKAAVWRRRSIRVFGGGTLQQSDGGGGGSGRFGRLGYGPKPAEGAGRLAAQMRAAAVDQPTIVSK